MNSIIIRNEKAGDEVQIREVNLRAFGQGTEADIVDQLRLTCPERISLIAEVENKIVGHLLFTPAKIETEHGVITGSGLAPMAVLPEYQNKGIGSQLVSAGLQILKSVDVPFVLVLGHPEYYRRFGFEKASKYKIFSEYKNVPDEAFMILINNHNLFNGISGIGKYRKEFDSAVS
jgi:putative acetyltransferase